jgi:Na+-transporting methylmalonyl-CoA/oxaloacetate decarboxylase gamma subunit
MFSTHTIIAQIDSTHMAADSSTTSIVLVGFLFVIVVLTALTAVTSALGAFFVKQAARDAAKSAEASRQAAEIAASQPAAPAAATTTGSAPSTAPPADTEDEDDPVFIAVIAAAVHSVIGDRAHRIVSVRSAGPGWAQEGRRQIFSSHRVR